VRFAYIENVATDDPRFRAGVDTFRRAVNVAAAVRRGIRIGHIGQRIGFFWTTIVNEGELLERFNVEVVPLSLAAFIEAALRRMAEHRAAYEAEAAGLRRSCRVEGFENDTPLMRILAVRDQILAHIAEQGLDAVAIEDFMPLVDAMGAYCFYANSLVGDTCPVACESDIHGAVSLVLLRRAAMAAEPVFLADLTVRHPQNDNGVLLWHAGAPASMRHPDDPVRLGRHWILPSPLAGMPHFRLKDGPITIARFDGDRGEYELAAGEGRTVAGPATLNNYTWMEVADWSRWERRLIRGPFIHHAGMMYGHVAGGLLEACRFIPGLRPVPLDRPDD
jgi:L-fucose isomerase-like protein